MKVIRGKFRESRAYLWYVGALFRPGIEVPVFAEPTRFEGNLKRFDDADLKLLIEEGRRQLDRQIADVERTKSRAGTLLTISAAEIAVLSASANRVFGHGWPVTLAWAASALFALLAAGGAASLLTAQAQYGRTDTQNDAAGPLPYLRNLARGYAESTSYGEQTVAARVTLLRDGVLLAVTAAILYAVVWPFTSTDDAPDRQPNPSPSGVPTICPMICTASSPSAPPATTAAVLVPSARATNRGPGPAPTPSTPTP
jgi:hypothetical protein